MTQIPCFDPLVGKTLWSPQIHRFHWHHSSEALSLLEEVTGIISAVVDRLILNSSRIFANFTGSLQRKGNEVMVKGVAKPAGIWWKILRHDVPLLDQKKPICWSFKGAHLWHVRWGPGEPFCAITSREIWKPARGKFAWEDALSSSLLERYDKTHIKSINNATLDVHHPWIQ